jgi:hypothetical protein
MATVSHVESPFNSTTGYGQTSPRCDDVPGGMMAAMLDTAVKNISSSDVWEALSMPAGAVVTEVGIGVITAEGGTITVDVGITGGATDGFLDGVSLNATAGICHNSLNAATAADTHSAGYYFASADTIDVLFNNAMDAGKFVIWCKYFLTNLN